MIDSERLEEIGGDCVYRDEEVKRRGREELMKEAVLVEGIINNFGFDPKRLELHKDEIYKMLLELPDNFMKSKGGGWSFLNACDTKDGEQWTGFHKSMELLVCLGIAIKKAEWLTPQAMWSAMPGGMPYFMVDDTNARTS